MADRALDLFDDAPTPASLTGTVELDGRTYTWTLHPDRLAEDWRERDGGPGAWAFLVTFQRDGEAVEVLSYNRRNQVWALVRGLVPP
jgi:hypothetical protein